MHHRCPFHKITLDTFHLEPPWRKEVTWMLPGITNGKSSSITVDLLVMQRKFTLLTQTLTTLFNITKSYQDSDSINLCVPVPHLTEAAVLQKKWYWYNEKNNLKADFVGLELIWTPKLSSNLFYSLYLLLDTFDVLIEFLVKEIDGRKRTERSAEQKAYSSDLEKR